MNKEIAVKMLAHLFKTNQAFCFDETGAIWSRDILQEYINDDNV